MSVPPCRFCATPLTATLVDLGETPLANSYPTAEDVAAGRERRFPLHARVCPACFLVQVDDSVPPDAIFSHYAYFSSYSDSWVAQAQRYAQAMIERWALGPDALVIEVASNDGYLLQHFQARGIHVLGIEPAANVAAVARAKGISTEIAFFGQATAARLAAQGRRADLMVANNVLAHVPDIRDFVQGFATLLKPEGVVTFEFPHILMMIREVQFDTIYHEHFSYLSLVAVERVLAAAGLEAFDVEHLATHGGSLRLYVGLRDRGRAASPALLAARQGELDAGLDRLAGYAGFGARVEGVRASFLAFLATARREGRKVAAYGAAAKGNSFLNVCGVGPQDIVCVFDRSSAKQGLLTPGTHIPIVDPALLASVRPDDLVILPWNLADEISTAMAHLADWGGRFVIAIPQTRIL
jgi:SAM-dependent methyltransferase